MQDVDVAILFEKAVRELDVATAVATILERRHGLSSRIVQQNYPPRDVLRSCRPAVVVLPFCYQERSNNAFFMRWREAAYVNLTWEQLFYPGNATAKTPRGRFALRHVIHTSWSEAYAGLLRAQGVPAEHIKVTGNPALALYDEPYRAIMPDRHELADRYGLDRRKRWVLFPENYNWAFYGPAMLNQMVTDGQGLDQVRLMRDAVSASFEEAMRWLAAAASDEVEIILRPRPATPPRLLAERLEAVIGAIPRGIHVIGDGSVREWILAADHVVSSSSTSLIEASIAGKPISIVAPTPWPRVLHQPWHDLVPRVTSSSAFARVVQGASDQHSNVALATWARSTLIGSRDPILAIADLIADVRARRIPIPSPAPWWSITLPSRYPLPRRVIYELRRRVRPWLPARELVVDEESRVDVAALRAIPARLARWRAILDPYLEANPTG